jgi:hypothetical protein
LTARVGGNPNNVQKALIERPARLTLHIELMDARALRAGTMTERGSRMYSAWGNYNSLRVCLRDLGLKEAAPAKPASLDAVVATRAGRDDQRAAICILWPNGRSARMSCS